MYGNQAMEQKVRSNMEREYLGSTNMQNPHFGSEIEKSAQPITAMNGAIAEMQMSIEALNHALDELERRLSPVCRPSQVGGNKEASGPRDVSSPLRDQLGICTLRIGALRNMATDILGRLEV